MITRLTMFTLITISIVATASADNKENNNMPTTEYSILNVIENMTTSFHNSDIEGIMASYEKTATVVFEPGKPISDPIVLRKMFEGTFTLNPKFSYSGHEVFISGDIAVHFAPWTMKGKTPDGTDINQNGLSVAVLRRQADGKWLMVIDNPHGQISIGK